MLYDRAQITGTARITKDGYFVADALVARANNIQEYLAGELGLTDRKPDEIVRVFRPEAEVFHKDALSSLAHRPITLDHPRDPVTSSNWKALAVGDVGDEVVRDGEFVRVPLKIMDARAIDSIKADRQEFSLGYTAEMVPEAGVHDGQPYDFTAKNFRYNHLAAVAHARGGTSLRIIDERKPLHLLTDGIGDAKAWLKKAIALHKKHMDGTAPTTGPAGEKSQMLMMEQMENALAALDGESPASRMKMDFNPKEPPMKIKIGDAEVDATNGEAVRIAVDGLNAKLADATTRATTAETDLAAAQTAVAAKDTEIAQLNQKLSDAAMTPAKLRDAAKAYAVVCDKARAVGVTFAEDADAEAIMKAVVDAKMGDAAQGWNADQIAASFAVLTKDAKPAEQSTFDASAFRGGLKSVGDAAAKEQQAFDTANDFNAWRKQA